MIARSWSGADWSVTVTDTEMTVARPSGTTTVSNRDASEFRVRQWWFRRTLHGGNLPALRLRGISRSDALDLERAIKRLEMVKAIAEAVDWHAATTRLVAGAQLAQRWIPTESVDAILAIRPQGRLIDRLRATGIETTLTEKEVNAAEFLDVDLERLIADTNEAIVAAELLSRRSFFDTIEKSPLTDEQARAVVSFDNRVQVIAAAGSGKTSVMVARAAYAVSRGFVSPDRILMLAFNKDAATELQERVGARFEAAGLDSTGLRSSTFHSFGLEVIGRATGEKPRPAAWLDKSGDIEMVQRIVDELRDRSATFRYRWDLYRLLFARAPTDIEQHEPDGYNRETKRNGYRTFGGDVVKSHGERLIADFLFMNGVAYDYERPYEVNVADATHSQYRPDFYYPGVDVWHEHWGIDRDGKPPDSFANYTEGMEWKRRVHGEHGTTLIETTWADVMFNDGLARLGDELVRSGLTLDWNPDRTPVDEWAKPMKHEDLSRLIRTFMTHVKSSSWTPEDLEHRLETDMGYLSGYRTRLFLDLYWEIHTEWNRRLAADASVDFEDMLVRAADCLEAGLDCGYDLVMVDEFQDVSRARARLVRGLMIEPDRFLLAVGDDWQSINRFAGADLSVMTGFTNWFGRSQQLALTTTFRCTQTVCDVAANFISQNPNQFAKPMRSSQRDLGEPVKIIRADDPTAILAAHLEELSAAVTSGSVPAGPSGIVSVFVLGRYNFQRSVLPARWPANLDVRFRTIHSSKGLEADYVVLPNMSTGNLGFPSNITDDPVLGLAMPTPDLFPHAEERRLLYVALTRARRAVILITPPNRMSPFVVELLKHSNVAVDGDSPVEICPKCGIGTTVRRPSPHRPFLGCSTFPACDYKRSLR